MALEIRRATSDDIPLLHGLILKLAEYERLSHEVSATEHDLRDALFGPRPVCDALIAFVAGEPAGYALYFETYSTFRGKRGIFLEDLFVEPEHRGKGIGAALLKHVAQVAFDLGGWLQWLVLDWNESGIAFYQRLGAGKVDDWLFYRLEGEALARLAR